MKKLFLSLVSCLSFLSPAFGEEPHVRVAILQEVSSARVTILEPCRVVDRESGRVLAEWPHVKWKEVKATHPGLQIGEVQFHTQAVVLESNREAMVRVNSRPYRGSLIFHRASGGRVTVVNRLGLEEYLVGALASEVRQGWPLEVLKAHAIVSRTIVAHRIWINRGKPFDVGSGTHLYYGVAAERADTRAAIEATTGQVLAYAGELLSATFSANCGGHTEDAAELWATQGELSPLRGRPDPFCRGLKHFRWRRSLSSQRFLEVLGKEGVGAGDLVSCDVTERNRSGRVRVLRVIGTKGSGTVPGRKLRELLGTDWLRSLNFTVGLSKGTLSFDGFGWGHGVGLCQWGAYGMAKHGYTMEEILQFYFPGAQRRKLEGLPGFPVRNSKRYKEL